MSDCRDWFRFNHKWDTWEHYRRVNFYWRDPAAEKAPMYAKDVYQRTCSVCGKVQREQINVASR